MATRVPVLLMVRELGPGGTERQLVEVARNLDRSLFEAHVGCFRHGIRTADLESDGIPVVSFPVNSFRNTSVLRGAMEFRRYVREHGIRVVHTFDGPMNIFGVPLARAFGVPVVLSSQRAHRELSPERKLLRLSDRLADAIVVNCDYIHLHLVQDEGVPDRKIRLCYNGLDGQRFRPLEGLRPEEGITIGVTCVLRPEKGLPILLDGFAMVRDLRPGMRLLIVGSGLMRESLEQQARQLGILPQCHFEPAASDVVPWLSRMHIFVLPSLSEALSNSLMEAMACGCAAVASNTGGNPELVLHEETGLLFEKENSADLARRLRRLIEDAELRQRLVCRSMERIRTEFSIEASVRRMGSIYQEVLEAKGHGSSSTKGAPIPST